MGKIHDKVKEKVKADKKLNILEDLIYQGFITETMIEQIVMQGPYHED